MGRDRLHEGVVVMRLALLDLSRQVRALLWADITLPSPVVVDLVLACKCLADLHLRASHVHGYLTKRRCVLAGVCMFVCVRRSSDVCVVGGGTFCALRHGADFAARRFYAVSWDRSGWR